MNSNTHKTTNPQAEALNRQIGAEAPAVLGMLSARGREIYFPKLGILSQSAEAAGKEINATIGIALEEDGSPMMLPCISANCLLKASETGSYAPSPGNPAIRKTWQESLLRKNPSLAGRRFSLPVVTSALTHGLSMSAYLFCEPGDELIMPDLYWENYDLIFSSAFGARPATYPLFSNGKFNLAGLEKKLASGAPSKKIVCLNFPNNPTGYTTDNDEAAAIAGVLIKAAASGSRLAVIIDDAYFGLVYEENIFRESMFGLLCNAHPNLLAIKLDGPTKEDYVWGFRIGFMTFGAGGGTPGVYAALEAKAAGAIRGSISNASNISQSLLIKAYAAGSYAAEKERKYEILRARYREVKRILAARPEYAGRFEALPFNSGYFMCLKMRSADPERLRRILLEKHSSGVIVMNNMVRVAFSSTPLAKLPVLFENIYRAAGEAAGKQ